MQLFFYNSQKIYSIKVWLFFSSKFSNNLIYIYAKRKFSRKHIIFKKDQQFLRMTLTSVRPWSGRRLCGALLQLSSHASLTCYELSRRSLHLCGIMGERYRCTEAEQEACSDRGVHLGAGGDWTGDIVPSRAADAILTASLLRANNNAFVPNIV